MGLAIGASLFSFLEIGFFLLQLLRISLNACRTGPRRPGDGRRLLTKKTSSVVSQFK